MLLAEMRGNPAEIRRGYTINADEYLGLELSEEEELLKSQGKAYRVNIIEPYYKGVPKPVEEGDFRIVRAVSVEGVLTLTACRIPE